MNIADWTEVEMMIKAGGKTFRESLLLEYIEELSRKLSGPEPCAKTDLCGDYQAISDGA